MYVIVYISINIRILKTSIKSKSSIKHNDCFLLMSSYAINSNLNASYEHSTRNKFARAFGKNNT